MDRPARPARHDATHRRRGLAHDAPGFSQCDRRAIAAGRLRPRAASDGGPGTSRVQRRQERRVARGTVRTPMIATATARRRPADSGIIARTTSRSARAGGSGARGRHDRVQRSGRHRCPLDLIYENDRVAHDQAGRAIVRACHENRRPDTRRPGHPDKAERRGSMTRACAKTRS